jgi:PKD repeat protein
MASCGDDDDAVIAPVSSFQFEVDADDFFKVNFSNFSKNTTIYVWDFGDNAGTSTEESPSYIYSASGDYTVTLTASDANGDSAVSTKDITITDPDEALTLLAGSVSKDWKLIREGAALGVGPSAAEFTLWFAAINDGSRNCIYDDVFTFTRSGGFEYNDAGTMWGEGNVYAGTDKESLTETCFDANAANMTVDGANNSAWLSSTTHTYDYEVATNKITLTGNGAWMGAYKLGTTAEVAVQQDAVSFDVKLISGGATGVDTLETVWALANTNVWKAIYVSYANAADEPALIAVNAGFDVTTSGLTATFTNKSSGATSFAWDFGDGGLSTDENPAHTYAADGTYTVILTAADGSESATATKDVIIDSATPATGAPTPSQAEADVFSIYSDAYAALDGLDTNPDWGQQAVTTGEMVGDDNVIKIAGLDYQGIDFGGAKDVSAKTMVHIDVWSKDVITTNFFLIGAGETPVALTTEAGTWKSFDIELSDYSSVVDLTQVIQFKFDATDSPTFFYDNIYFY